MRKLAAIFLFVLCALAWSSNAATPHAKGPSTAKAPATRLMQAPVPAGETDKTLHAMHDELERSVNRLSIPGMNKPSFIEYRLLDVDVRNVTASFGSLVASATTRSRFMSVDVRVGDYHLDSSNFISEDGFQGFLGNTGQVGIDRDYSSLRQDLWLATDQAYKGAVTQMSLKQAFLRSLTKPPEIDDFSKAEPIVRIDPRLEPDWTSRDWEDEARKASESLRNFPEIYGTRVNYYLIYVTQYLMTSEGTTIRTSTPLAAIEAALDTQAEDGMPLHNSYAVYVRRPTDLPGPDVVSNGLAKAGTQIMQLRASPLVPDFTGPVLFDPAGAGSALAQMLAPSLSGARPPLSMVPAFDQMMDRMGARSEWTGRVGTRVFPTTVSLVDDPTVSDFQGRPLLGGYELDDEGVKGQRVELVENGILKNLLMSRRPGPDFLESNGHGRAALLSDQRALASNLFLNSSAELSPADMKKKFLDACKEDGHEWCIEIKEMDNPALTSLNSQDYSDFIGEIAGGIGSGERLPLMVYRVYVADGREELVRGGHIEGLTLRSLRNMLAVGNDTAVYTYMQTPSNGFAGTALGAFGGAQGGIPSTVVTPSLLLDEVEIRGFHGEPRRLPLVTAPPLK